MTMRKHLGLLTKNIYMNISKGQKEGKKIPSFLYIFARKGLTNKSIGAIIKIIQERNSKGEMITMNEFFGYCGWDFGGALNNKFQRGEHVRIGRTIYRVIFRIGSWHLLKRMGE